MGGLFAADEVIVGFAAADDLEGVAIDEDFGGAGAVVVVGARGHAVAPSGEDGEEVAAFDGGEVARSLAR